MEKKIYRFRVLNAWEMAIIASALAEYAAKIGGSDTTMALSKVFENAKSATVTHG